MKNKKIRTDYLKENKLSAAAMWIILLYVLLVVFVPMFSKYSYSAMNTEDILLKPFTNGHLLGCDNAGRDIFVRECIGARVSLLIGISCALINSAIGSIVGGYSALKGGKTDMIISSLVDLLYGIPNLIVAFLLMMVLGSGIKSICIAICITGWIGPCRFMRGEVYRIKNNEYVLSSVLAGHSDMHIIIHDILPNLKNVLITNICMAVPGIIFQEAFFSYIGIGVLPPQCSLGSLAKESAAYMKTAPHMLISTVLFIVIITLSFNFAGEGIGELVSPKRKQKQIVKSLNKLNF